MDYSKLTNEELLALKNKDYSKLSNDTLLMLREKQSQTNQEQEPQTLKGGVKVDVTPSGLFKGSQNVVGSAIAAPFVAKRDNISVKDAFNQNMNKVREWRKENPTPFQDFAVDTAGYSGLSLIPGLEPVAAAKNAGTVARLGNFALNSAKLGAIPGALEGLKNGIGSAGLGALGGSAIAGGMQAVLPPVLQGVGRGFQKIAQNPSVQKATAKTIEALTSVPEKFSNLALQKQLANKSILSGKFNAENAYRPIEEKLIQAKSKLPTNESYAEQFYQLGQKAKTGLENIKEAAGEQINQVLEGLSPEPINIEGLRKSINTVVKQMGKGGDINPAKVRANRELGLIRDLLGEEGTKVKPIDLHNAKEILYDMANYETEGGIRNDLLKQSANQIKNFLRSKFPEYKAPNDKYSLIKKVEYELGGINSSTIGGKLSNYGSSQNIEKGLDRRLRNIDDILPDEQKFIKDTNKLVSEQKNTNEIKKLINSSYERNPRLLSNINDTAREQALENLQNQSGINFMDELNNIRAREALEKWFPGQGGGSGSEQGFGNLLRNSIIGGAPTAALLTHNPAAVLGLGLVSPKITGQGLIKGLGNLRNIGNKLINADGFAGDVARRVLPAALIAPWQ